MPKYKSVKMVEAGQDVIQVYKCDVWHTWDSMDLIGIATDLGTAIDMCQQAAKHHGFPKLNDYDMEQLQDIGQTQSYKGEGEFFLQVVTLNKPIL